MELKALDKDIKRFRYWGSRVKSQVDIEEAGARGQLVVSLFRHCTYS